MFRIPDKTVSKVGGGRYLIKGQDLDEFINNLCILQNDPFRGQIFFVAFDYHLSGTIYYKNK